MPSESPGWSTILNSTMPMYIRQEVVNILRNRILLARMEQNGRISMNNSGRYYDWKVKYKRNPMQDYTDGDVLTFARVDRYVTAELPNDRGYMSTESMSLTETLQNSGNEAIIKLWDNKAKSLAEDLRENFCDELYIDGNAAGNEKKIHGIESFLGAAATNGYPGFVNPSDTYAGLSTVLGNKGGSWTNGTWPQGSSRTTQYDYWSPILVDYTSPVPGAYTSAVKTFRNTCNEALRKMITKTSQAKSLTGNMDLILLEGQLFEDYKNAQDSRQQIRVERGQNIALVSLGFNVLEFDGVAIASEFGMPDATGYGFNTNNMELKSMQSELFSSDGPYWEQKTQSWDWAVRFIGNMCCNPRGFGKLKNYGQA